MVATAAPQCLEDEIASKSLAAEPRGKLLAFPDRRPDLFSSVAPHSRIRAIA